MRWKEKVEDCGKWTVTGGGKKKLEEWMRRQKRALRYAGCWEKSVWEGKI